MKPRFWIPLYPGDFARATDDFDSDETAAYIRLIIHYWERGPLPESEYLLARVAHIPLRQWTNGLGNRVLRDFHPIDHAGTVLWHNDALDASIKRADKISESRAGSARKAAEIRWLNKKREP